MKVKVLSLMVGSVLALTAFSGTASAANPGNINENGANCHGQIVSFFSSNGTVNPGQAAKFFSDLLGEKVTAGQLNQLVKEFCTLE